jgi:hypothetical protein
MTPDGSVFSNRKKPARTSTGKPTPPEILNVRSYTGRRPPARTKPIIDKNLLNLIKTA